MEVIKVINDELNNLFEIRTDDGYTIESVHYRGNTLCISSQVGCSVKCSFCASGLKGLIRNLSFEEIIDQYKLVVKNGFNVENITFAGIGEPLLNWENVKKAFEYFKSLGLKVSFYTTGFPLSNFKELLTINHNGLTLSLHSVLEDKRKTLIPNSHSIDNLISTLEDYIKNLSSRKKKLYSIGYLLIEGVNDSQEEIDILINIAKRLGLSVSLLKYNEIEGIEYKTTTDEKYEEIFLRLRKNGIKVTLSNRYRTRKIGGCGTLMVNRLQCSTF
ncbi:MAG: radical SAM protein [Hydrogenothermaceae bacterium]|nr:radical SAM protein [Hydrogenothermaceae bacterium]